MQYPDIDGLMLSELESGAMVYQFQEGEWVTVFDSHAELFRSPDGGPFGNSVMELNHQGTSESIESVVRLMLNHTYKELRNET